MSTRSTDHDRWQNNQPNDHTATTDRGIAHDSGHTLVEAPVVDREFPRTPSALHDPDTDGNVTARQGSPC